MEIKFKAIGVIHTPIFEQENAPIQSSRSTINGTVELNVEYKEGLEDIDGFSHIFLIYLFHKSNQEAQLKVQPFLDNQVHGVFATRYPCRPNSIGISVVKIFAVDNLKISFSGADMLDGTPLLDIKPYIPEFDIFSVEKIGWFKN